MKSSTTHIVFDAANTLIHKPEVWVGWSNTLTEFGHSIDVDQIKQNHKLVSEVIKFPDVTSADFYKEFNAEVMLSLGVVPTDDILDTLFKKCSYLPWEPFDDIGALKELDIKMSVISNFSKKLRDLLPEKIDVEFEHIVISQELGDAKPSLGFYKQAFEIIGEKPENILYIGDSLKLDIIPAGKLGVHGVLIDRDQVYPEGTKNRISSFKDIANLLK